MIRFTPRHLLRRALLRAADRLDCARTGRDARYRDSQIFARASLGDTVLEGSNLVCEDCMFRGDVRVGYGTTFGPRCVVNGNVTIGRYCQIAAAVALYAVDHPTGHLTTYVSKPLFDGELRQFSPERAIAIGSDVWIGHGAVVLKGVTVGHGAAIGAGSIVTRNVPSYAVVAGNPARVLRLRFDERVVEALERLRWWDLTPAELATIRDLFDADLTADGTKALELIDAAADRVGRTRTSSRQPRSLAAGPELRFPVREKRA